MVALATVATALLGACTGSQTASDPPVDSPTAQPASTWVVTLGDSYISGEGARWAGNLSQRPRRVDALGPTAYDDGPDGERAPGCHRASVSEATLDVDGVRGKNLACSGATTRDVTRQARKLQRFAATRDVSHVVVSIGGNDFGFGRLVSRCALGFIGLTSARQACNGDADLTRAFEPANAQRISQRITTALRQVVTAMRGAGRDDDYTLVVQTYPSPLPPSADNRYLNDRARYRRGCPFFDADLDWAAERVLGVINGAVADAARRVRGGPDVVTLDLEQAFAGHRLCESGAAAFDETRLRSWRSVGAGDQLEWVNRVYFTAAPWQMQESLHPNYWGTLALQDCAAQVVVGGDRRRATCVPTGRLDAAGQPVMRLGR